MESCPVDNRFQCPHRDDTKCGTGKTDSEPDSTNCVHLQGFDLWVRIDSTTAALMKAVAHLTPGT